MRHPFMKINEMAAAHERGDAVDVRWQSLLEDPHDGVRLMARAAAAEPRLRGLFPYTSHHFLCFSRCTIYPHSMDLPVMVMLGGGRCRALGRDDSVLLEGSPAEAAAAVVAALPDDCGPAISGTLGR
jgi:hypothetical protein